MTHRPSSRRSFLSFERLEFRDAPAVLVGQNKVTYEDVDGDNVTVTLSKPILDTGNVAAVFTFNNGFGSSGPQQLESINLSGFGTKVNGVAITTSALRSSANHGDGFAALGEINADGLDLGPVNIDGDLGRIVAGDQDTATSGLKGLTAQSMGRFGTATGALSLNSLVQGKIDFMRIKSDVVKASIDAMGGTNGKIGSVFIGGSLIGGTVTQEGAILSDGDMGPVTIGGNVTGDGFFCGVVSSGGKLASVRIGGNVDGRTGLTDAAIMSKSDMGLVTIGGKLSGEGFQSGRVSSGGKLAGVTIGGSVQGGDGQDSGQIFSAGDMGHVAINGNLIGGVGANSGEVHSEHKLASLNVGGSVRGGDGDSSGHVLSVGDMGFVTIAGDLIGGSKDPNAGEVSAGGKLAGVKVGGSVMGGEGDGSGHIHSNLDTGFITIGGNLIGGKGITSGAVASGGKLAGVKIGGSVEGGQGDGSGLILSSSDTGSVTIGGNLSGGAGLQSGLILIGGHKLESVRIGGSVRGGTGTLSGGIDTGANVGSITIGGDVVGGSATGNADLEVSGYIAAQRIASLTLGGSLIAGTNATTGFFNNNGIIHVADDLGTVLIKGSIIGNSTNTAVISARGKAAPTATSDLAIGNLRVLGRVEYGLIWAGADVNGHPMNADAQIGPVSIGGDWIASSIAAGAVPDTTPDVPPDFFGDGDDAKMAGGNVRDTAISSKITSLTIGGQALGTVDNVSANDHYGIVAEEVGAVRIGGTPLVLRAGNGNDNFLIGITNDFSVREI